MKEFLQNSVFRREVPIGQIGKMVAVVSSQEQIVLGILSDEGGSLKLVDPETGRPVKETDNVDITLAETWDAQAFVNSLAKSYQWYSSALLNERNLSTWRSQ